MLIKNYQVDSAVLEYFHKVGMSKNEQKIKFKEYRDVIKSFLRMYTKQFNYERNTLDKIMLSPTIISDQLTAVNERNLKEKTILYSKFSQPTKKRVVECYRKYYILASSINYFEKCLIQGRRTHELLHKEKEKYTKTIPHLVNEKIEYLQFINKEVETIIVGLKNQQIKYEDCINKLGKMDKGISLETNAEVFKVLDQVIYSQEKCQVSKKKSYVFTGASVIQKSLDNMKLLEKDQQSPNSSTVVA